MFRVEPQNLITAGWSWQTLRMQRRRLQSQKLDMSFIAVVGLLQNILPLVDADMSTVCTLPPEVRPPSTHVNSAGS